MGAGPRPATGGAFAIAWGRGWARLTRRLGQGPRSPQPTRRGTRERPLDTDRGGRFFRRLGSPPRSVGEASTRR